MGIFVLNFLAAMAVLASLHAFQQFREHPVAMTLCCVTAFLLMYVLF